MSVLSVASMEGEPRAVFAALEHHWAESTLPDDSAWDERVVPRDS